MPVLQLEAGHVQYQVEGEGEPIVFINDCGFTQAYWYPSVALLKDTFKCVTIDPRGFGGSETGTAGGTFDVEAQAEDLHQALLALGLGEVHLIGHGFGSLIAGSCLQNHPQDVRTLTLVNLAIAPQDPELADLHARLGQTVMLCRHLLSLPLVGRLILRRYSIERIPSQYRSWIAKDLTRLNPVYFWEMLSSALDENTVGSFWRTVVGTRTPLLLIASADDRLSSLQVMRRLYAQVGAATLATMKNSAHFPMLEFREKFTDIIKTFLRKKLPPPPRFGPES
ncbi:MAG: alpha/beta hydrolase [Acidobacteria bacterium]|nr:alpha/beta hydrolase [Acidobacteriota bacterium]